LFWFFIDVTLPSVLQSNVGGEANNDELSKGLEEAASRDFYGLKLKKAK
jgi:hypothetical protein